MRQSPIICIGFTLVEILVVITIIGILATAMLVALNPLRQFQKTRDTDRITSAHQIADAIERYIVAYGVPPANQINNAVYYSNQPNFLQELVTSGELRKIPKAQSGTAFGYYNYGKNNNYGAIVGVMLEGIDDTVTPPEGSCRPFTNNWCSSTIPSKWYCICVTY